MKKLAWIALSMTACAVEPAVDSSDEQAPVAAPDQTSSDEQSIIGGTTDTGDPCVVSVFAHASGSTSGSICTGTVIGPHTVLTAAHCVSPAIVGAGMVYEILSGTTLSLPGIVASSVTWDMAWNQNNLGACHDFGIVHTTNVLPFPTCGLGALNTAASLRIVGYGSNTHTNTGVGTKRQATVSIVGFNSLLVQDGTSSQQTCHGDSGGPAFQGANVVGVTSFGQDAPPQVCFNGGYHCRVDANLAYINANNF